MLTTVIMMPSIQFNVMANQTTSSTLACINEAEKIRVQEMYQLVNRKQGNIKFDVFWRQLLVRGCFDESGSLATEKVTHHAMVAFQKLARINKRTPLMGKAGPEA